MHDKLGGEMKGRPFKLPFLWGKESDMLEAQQETNEEQNVQPLLLLNIDSQLWGIEEPCSWGLFC